MASPATTAIAYPNEAIVFAATCACTFSVMGTLGNLITVVALFRDPKLRSHPTTALVISLCMSDLLFCMISLPLNASRYIHKGWIHGDALCKLFAVIVYSNVAVSLLSMTAITLNRFSLIACRDYYKRMYSRESIIVQLILVWTFSISLMMPPLFGVWGELGLQQSTFSCTILKKQGRSIKGFLFVSGFVLPFTFITISYWNIYWTIRSQRQKLDTDKTTRSGPCRMCNREDTRLTAMMLTIFICFVVCFFPLTITYVTTDDDQYPWINIFATVLAWASSVINPFIYAGYSRKYRAAYHKLFSSLKCWGQPSAALADKKWVPGKSSVDNTRNNTLRRLDIYTDRGYSTHSVIRGLEIAKLNVKFRFEKI